MEDLRIDINKLNKSIEPAADLPRLPDGSIDLEKISKGKNEKGNYIVPDEILEKYYKELPSGTINESGNSWASSKGILRKATPEIRAKGGEALKAAVEQRQRLKETIDILLQKAANADDLEGLDLPEGVDKQTAGVARMIDKWIKTGDYNIFKELRDTAGEKPTEKIDAQIGALTPEDQELINRVAARIKES